MAAQGLRVGAQPNTRVIEVTFDSHDPRLGADLVNSLADGFAEQNREARRQSSRKTSKWLREQLADVKTKLERDEDALQKYAGDSNLTFLSDKGTAGGERLRQLQLDLLKAQSDRVAKQSAYELGSAAKIESLPEVLDDPTLKDYQVQLTALQRQLAELSSIFTPENLKMVNVQAQIATVEAALQSKRSNILSRIQNEYEAASRRESLLQTEYASQVALLSHQATNIAHYSVLQREVDTTRQLYDSMMQRVKEAGLASAMQANEIQVIESATPARSPFKPDFRLNTTFGLFSGILLGVGLVILRAKSARVFQAPGDIAIQLNVPELGIIPSSMDVPRAQRLLGKSGLQTLSAGDTAKLELMTWQQWHSAIAESFRLTLTSLLLSWEKNGERPRAIVVSSALPGEGKTTVISNLAIALACMNRRVLLIDGDLRKPRLHQVFDVSNRMGFSDVLAGNSTMPICPTKIPNLFLLSSGKGVDESLFFTAPLADLFRRFKDEFDMILIDTPPLLRMSDARMLSHHADAVILVVAQHTSRDAVVLATQQLAEDGSRLLGTILNNWNPKTHSQAYREYGEYEKRYGSDERSTGPRAFPASAYGTAQGRDKRQHPRTMAAGPDK